MAEIGTLTVRMTVIDAEELEQLRSQLEAAKEVIKNQRLDADWWIEALKEASDDADKAEDIANAAIELAYAEWQKTVPGIMLREGFEDLGRAVNALADVVKGR